MKNTAYRTNERAEARASRLNRAYDYLLYWGPLRRLAFLVALTAPFAIATGIAVHFKTFAIVAAYVVAVLMGVFPLIPLLDSKLKMGAKALLIALMPASHLFILGHWVMTGRFTPLSWAKKVA